MHIPCLTFKLLQYLDLTDPFTLSTIFHTQTVTSRQDVSFDRTSASKRSNARKQWLWDNDPEWREAFSDRRRKSSLGNTNFLGKKHTKESKVKMSKSHKGKHEGSKNSQFGTMWITNGIDNKKIRKDDMIPEGWRKGRFVKSKY